MERSNQLFWFLQAWLRKNVLIIQKKNKKIGEKNNPKDKGKDGQWSQGIGASQPPETGPRGERNSTGLQNVNHEVDAGKKIGSVR